MSQGCNGRILGRIRFGAVQEEEAGSHGSDGKVKATEAAKKVEEQEDEEEAEEDVEDEEEAKPEIVVNTPPHLPHSIIPSPQASAE